MPPSDSFAGTNRFEVRALLGEGATGRVYRVLDREMSRDVALKTLRLPAAEALYRLKREFRARAGIVHPNLLQLHELFVEGDSCFFTMEAIDGVDFLQWARGGLGLGGTRGSTLEASTGDTPGSSTSPAQAEAPARQPPPPGPPLEADAGSWERLRHALVQLLQALQALHAAGLVHRDIKPANVLVTPQERVVVLDFGLAAALHAPGPERSRPHRPVGTPFYMAPEQVTGGAVTPAADLYAVGAMLYEVLTGAPPFAALGGSPLEHKVHRLPPHVLELAPQAPEDLAGLAMELLSPDPGHRPGVNPCGARLAPAPGGSPRPVAAAEQGQGQLFVGRARELEALTQALDEVAGQGRQLTVHIHGPSGIGKSTLVRHFLSLQSRARAPLVLHGRCHPQESVPYEALDACIDALARHLEALPAAEAASLVPARASVLARLFPVLGRLAAFQREPLPTPLPDVAELRRQGAQALRELLERLARGTRPLVLWVDDVQWGDADSAPLFEELLRPPAPPLLLVLTWRGEDRDASPLLRRLLELTRPGEGSRPVTRELALGALLAREVGTLASAMLGDPETSAQVQAVIAQAEGNPFIARELVRHVGAHAAREGAGTLGAQVDVARLVVERIQALPEEERALLEVASLAGRPLARGVALRAAGLGEGGRGRVASLRDSGLLREVPGDGEPGLGAYHERIREALLGALPAETRARRHRAVAEALTARGSEDEEALLLHWEGAGEPLQAGHHAVRSANRAARALAFENAATLYRKALELLGARADRPLLLERLAEALANLGRAEEAARHYLEAARALGGALERPQVRDLQRRASEQYLKSGRFADGWREMHAVLQALGVPVPGSFFSAVWAATWRRVLFLARRLDAPSAATPSPEERHRLEVLWTASTSWVMVNPMLSDAFRTMHLLGARRLGEDHLYRALALEATMELHIGGRWMETIAGRLLDKVRQRVERTGTPYDQAWYALALANRGYTLGRWREVVEAGERAEALFREHCPGSAWERVTLAIFHHHALAMRGQLRHLAARLESFEREALQRGDLHARCEVYLGEPVVAWLARDRADEARARAEETLAAQSPRTSTWPENAYRRQQFANLIAAVYTAHYRGEPWPAWRAVQEGWEPLRGSFMLPLRTTGLNLRHMRARAALGAASTLPHTDSPPPSGVDARWRKPALLADVRAQLRVIDRDSLGCARPLGHLVRAGLAWQETDVPGARRWLEEAVTGFEREDMALYREAARYALGALRDGHEGQALQRQAREWMEAEGVVRPGALTASLVPGITAWHEAMPAQRA
ncbi:serine/threonine-protein kinase PknK [Vitiosangium sp. GDMCC 1.1324]|uniref:serine/threonine-protein kinase n=1 Tax=Vitiosangium sp. (strain GDMCC 1.1324) TaxID=2138576 RepID=UPI000D3B4DA7|nr:serine/threonine-protein kinase [Vitiosangium sp. GDMCC 1.1324]PTL79660.1 serine/threonine-protein kinase PknK [Vitiosangium sp. GDMCC 1.1324]